MHIIPSLFQGGAENQLEQLIIESKKNSFDEHIVVVLIDERTERWVRLENEKIKIIHIDLKKTSKISGFIKLRRLIKRTSPDVLHSWMYHANLISYISTIGLNTPLLWGIRRSDIPKGSTGFISKLCSLISYSKKIHLVANSYSGLEIHKKQGYNDIRFKVIDNGFNFKKTKNIISLPFELNSECLNFLSVGRATQDKGHELLIEAVSLLKNEVNLSKCKKIKFYIIGRGIPERLNKLVKDKNIDDVVELYDNIDDISSLMNQFDVFVLPSLTEGFPNVLVEAMNANLLCIASDVGDVNRILDDCSLVFPAKDIIAIKDNIVNKVLMNDSEIKLISNKLFILSKNYSSYKMWLKYNNLYNKMCG
ncbi:TPA: glycosyltransferase [Photobacterium damselae]